MSDEELVLPTESTLAVARWLKWSAPLFVPLLVAVMALGAWIVVQDWRAGKWDNLWALAFLLATFGGFALLFMAALVYVFRGRITLNHQGMGLRGVFGSRFIPWSGVEGYRFSGGQLFAYPAGDRWPVNLSHFESQELLYAWLYYHAQNLQAAELAQERQEIADPDALGGLRRAARTLNWIAYAAAAVGVLNALFFGHPLVQLASAVPLVLVPVVFVMLAFRHRDVVRLDYREGSLYPEGLTGILAASLALGLVSLLDPHTVLGERFLRWALPLAALSAAVWLHLEWQRILAQRRWMFIALHVTAIAFLGAFWAGGSIYQVNKHADVSAPAWDTTRVTKLWKSEERTGTAYYAEVAPWKASPEPVELSLSRAAYEKLRVGAAVEIGVRNGALDIPWVDEVRPK
jgi:hypothetical protein